MCLRAILQEAPVSKLKNVCKMSCKKDKTVLPVQVTDSTIVFTNLPKTGSVVICGKNKYQLVHDVEIGALQITLGCSCKLRLKGVTIAQSFTKLCTQDTRVPFTILALIPAQWTTLEHWRSQPHDEDVSTGIRFDSIDDILQLEHNETETAGEWIATEFNKVSFITSFVQVVQTCFSIYVLCRLAGLNGAIAFLANQGNASSPTTKDRSCVYPLSMEIVVYCIFAFFMLYLLPKIYTKLKHHIENAGLMLLKELHSKQQFKVNTLACKLLNYHNPYISHYAFLNC